jgi:hypothetical protein
MIIVRFPPELTQLDLPVCRHPGRERAERQPILWQVTSGVRSPKSEVRTRAVTQKMLKMQDDPDELLKTKGKLKLKKLDPDGCLKIKELRLNLAIAGRLLKGSMVIARFRAKRLRSSLIPAKNRRNFAIVGECRRVGFKGNGKRANRAHRQCLSLRWHGCLGHDFTRAGCPCHIKMRRYRQIGPLAAFSPRSGAILIG